MKECRDCRQAFPLDNYYADKSHTDGRASYCKPCHRARNRAAEARWVERNPRPDRTVLTPEESAERKRAQKREQRRRAKERDPEKFRQAKREQRRRARERDPEGYLERQREKERARRERLTPEQRVLEERAKRLRQYYKLSLAEYDAMLTAQGGGCAVCGATDDLCVDHDHDCCPTERTCGKCLRAILCRGCNAAEGSLSGNADRAMALAAYMRRWAA